MSEIITARGLYIARIRLSPLVLLVALGLSLAPAATHAAGGTLVDATSCATLEGAWDIATNTCTVTNLHIAMDETLQINPGATLIINGIVINAGAINNLGSFIDNNAGGSINNTGSIHNDGTFNNAGALTNIGTIHNNSTGTINNNSLIDNNNTIINNGSINNNYFGTINNSAGGTLTNNGKLNNDGVINNNANSTIANAGDIVNTRTINDNCGSFNSFPATVILVDQCPPTASITSPADNAIYLLGQVVAAGYSCADQAPGAEIAACVGTVPSGNNIDTSVAGTLPFVVTANDIAGNVTIANKPYTVLAPRDYLQWIRDNMVALRTTVSDKKDGDKLDKALESLINALDLTLWSDSLHLAAKNGDKVTKNIKDAASQLEKLLKDKKSALPDTALRTFGNQLVTVMRKLALISLDEATRAGADPKEIGKAHDEQAKGDVEFTASDYPKAVEHYGKAWQHALQAASRVGSAGISTTTTDTTDGSVQSNTIFMPLVINQ